MEKVISGIVQFQEKAFEERKDLFAELANGQSPEVLFITCSDSRIDPNLVTQTEPGDLFICRNAGNIVPPHVKTAGGMTASIEFAVAALNVPHIVVCGHTECGAMKGAMAPEGLDSLPHIREWLGYSKAAVDVVNELGKDLDDKKRMEMLLQQNVILQLQHLRTHPTVATRLAKGDLQLHGWVYDIRTGDVSAYDEGQNKFKPVSEQYAAEVAKHATQGCQA